MNSVALVGRLLISLAFVLGLMWLIARRVKRSGGRGKSGRLIELLSRQQLTRSSSVAVIRVLDQGLIIGVTDGQVAVLGEVELDAVQQALDAGETSRPVRAPRAPRPPRTVSEPRTDTVSDRGALTGSALSLGTWRQTLDTLRDVTARRT